MLMESWLSYLYSVHINIFLRSPIKKKGTCLITLQKYVIINMYNELEKKKWWHKPNPFWE